MEDVQVREKLKHATSKAKKLEKQLQKDKEKVGYVGEMLNISCLSDVVLIIFHECSCPLENELEFSMLRASGFISEPNSPPHPLWKSCIHWLWVLELMYLIYIVGELFTKSVILFCWQNNLPIIYGLKRGLGLHSIDF